MGKKKPNYKQNKSKDNKSNAAIINPEENKLEKCKSQKNRLKNVKSAEAKYEETTSEAIGSANKLIKSGMHHVHKYGITKDEVDTSDCIKSECKEPESSQNTAVEAETSKAKNVKSENNTAKSSQMIPIKFKTNKSETSQIISGKPRTTNVETTSQIAPHKYKTNRPQTINQTTALKSTTIKAEIISQTTGVKSKTNRADTSQMTPVEFKTNKAERSQTTSFKSKTSKVDSTSQITTVKSKINKPQTTAVKLSTSKPETISQTSGVKSKISQVKIKHPEKEKFDIIKSENSEPESSPVDVNEPIIVHPRSGARNKTNRNVTNRNKLDSKYDATISDIGESRNGKYEENKLERTKHESIKCKSIHRDSINKSPTKSLLEKEGKRPGKTRFHCQTTTDNKNERCVGLVKVVPDSTERNDSNILSKSMPTKLTEFILHSAIVSTSQSIDSMKNRIKSLANRGASYLFNSGISTSTVGKEICPIKDDNTEREIYSCKSNADINKTLFSNSTTKPSDTLGTKNINGDQSNISPLTNILEDQHAFQANEINNKIDSIDLMLKNCHQVSVQRMALLNESKKKSIHGKEADLGAYNNAILPSTVCSIKSEINSHSSGLALNDRNCASLGEPSNNRNISMTENGGDNSSVHRGAESAKKRGGNSAKRRGGYSAVDGGAISAGYQAVKLAENWHAIAAENTTVVRNKAEGSNKSVEKEELPLKKKLVTSREDQEVERIYITFVHQFFDSHKTHDSANLLKFYEKEMRVRGEEVCCTPFNQNNHDLYRNNIEKRDATVESYQNLLIQSSELSSKVKLDTMRDVYTDVGFRWFHDFEESKEKDFEFKKEKLQMEELEQETQNKMEAIQEKKIFKMQLLAKKRNFRDTKFLDKMLGVKQSNNLQQEKEADAKKKRIEEKKRLDNEKKEQEDEEERFAREAIAKKLELQRLQNEEKRLKELKKSSKNEKKQKKSNAVRKEEETKNKQEKKLLKEESNRLILLKELEVSDEEENDVTYLEQELKEEPFYKEHDLMDESNKYFKINKEQAVSENSFMVRQDSEMGYEKEGGVRSTIRKSDDLIAIDGGQKIPKENQKRMEPALKNQKRKEHRKLKKQRNEEQQKVKLENQLKFETERILEEEEERMREQHRILQNIHIELEIFKEQQKFVKEPIKVLRKVILVQKLTASLPPHGGGELDVLKRLYKTIQVGSSHLSDILEYGKVEVEEEQKTECSLDITISSKEHYTQQLHTRLDRLTRDAKVIESTILIKPFANKVGRSITSVNELNRLLGMYEELIASQSSVIVIEDCDDVTLDGIGGYSDAGYEMEGGIAADIRKRDNILPEIGKDDIDSDQESSNTSQWSNETVLDNVCAYKQAIQNSAGRFSNETVLDNVCAYKQAIPNSAGRFSNETVLDNVCAYKQAIQNSAGRFSNETVLDNVCAYKQAIQNSAGRFSNETVLDNVCAYKQAIQNSAGRFSTSEETHTISDTLERHQNWNQYVRFKKEADFEAMNDYKALNTLDVDLEEMSFVAIPIYRIYYLKNNQKYDFDSLMPFYTIAICSMFRVNIKDGKLTKLLTRCLCFGEGNRMVIMNRDHTAPLLHIPKRGLETEKTSMLRQHCTSVKVNLLFEETVMSVPLNAHFHPNVPTNETSEHLNCDIYHPLDYVRKIHLDWNHRKCYRKSAPDQREQMRTKLKNLQKIYTDLKKCDLDTLLRHVKSSEDISIELSNVVCKAGRLTSGDSVDRERPEKEIETRERRERRER